MRVLIYLKVVDGLAEEMNLGVVGDGGREY
jgi:hypothetical protein